MGKLFIKALDKLLFINNIKIMKIKLLFNTKLSELQKEVCNFPFAKCTSIKDGTQFHLASGI
jgi:hypothetical protein